MDKFQEVQTLRGIKSLNIKDDTELIYFNVSKTIDPSLLQGLEIDLQSKEIQLFENGDVSFGVQINEDILCKQLIPLVVNNGQLERKQFSKIINIFETTPITGIKRKAIRKLKPITLKEPRE